MKWYHNEYTEEALSEMQQEAENRVREMQSRARLFLEPQAPSPKNAAMPSSAPKSPVPPPLSGGFSSLSPENDRLVLLALLWLLWNEHADGKLLLALVYLLL